MKKIVSMLLVCLLALSVVAMAEGQYPVTWSQNLNGTDYDFSADATKEIVPWLKSQGYQLVTVSDLLRYKYNTEPQALYYGYTFMELDGGHNAGMQ